MGGMTRSCEGGVMAPATSLANWDMLALIKLLQSNVFSHQVHVAVKKMNEYTRRDMAHERFDCDWDRDCKFMVELLQALGHPDDAAKLQEFCESKTHTIDGGEIFPGFY